MQSKHSTSTTRRPFGSSFRRLAWPGKRVGPRFGFLVVGAQEPKVHPRQLSRPSRCTRRSLGSPPPRSRRRPSRQSLSHEVLLQTCESTLGRTEHCENKQELGLFSASPHCAELGPRQCQIQHRPQNQAKSELQSHCGVNNVFQAMSVAGEAVAVSSLELRFK